MALETDNEQELKVKKTVNVGDEAPDFEARDDGGQQIKLSDFRGQKNVLLVFYPYAFTRTCTSEFCGLRDNPLEIVDDNTEVIGISSDTVATLRAWKAAENYINRFVSDFWPHGAIAKAYGAFDELIGTAVRCTFLIDKEGIVRFAEYNDLASLGQARDQDRWREAIRALD